MGNLGGIFFAIIFRFEPSPAGKAFWISGAIAIVSKRACLSYAMSTDIASQGVNLLLCIIRVPQL
jgi:NNP family nitrate/nitrite transporter-like MFS transporter